MLFGGSGVRTRRLWTVNQTAIVTNARASGITGQNPLRISEHYRIAYITIHVINRLLINLNAVRVYGAPNGSTLDFPPQGSVNEVLVSTVTNLASNRGVVRVPMMRTETPVDFRRSDTVIPRFLLLEYTTNLAQAGASLVFEVSACLIGPHISSSE